MMTNGGLDSLSTPRMMMYSWRPRMINPTKEPKNHKKVLYVFIQKKLFTKDDTCSSEKIVDWLESVEDWGVVVNFSVF